MICGGNFHAFTAACFSCFVDGLQARNLTDNFRDRTVIKANNKANIKTNIAILYNIFIYLHIYINTKMLLYRSAVTAQPISFNISYNIC
jgi:hypothetical protein